MALKDAKYDGKGGLWKANHPSIAAQGNIQIGGRVIALTLWHNKKGGSAPEYTLSVNDQKTSFEDMIWFKSLNASSFANGKAPTVTGTWQEQTKAIVKPPVDEDIPF